MKRIISVIVCIALILAAAVSFAETYTIGIGQFAQHGSLDNCYQGFIEGLAEAGLVEGETSRSTCRTRRRTWASPSRSPRSLPARRWT